jgi:hypothetical protein
MDSPPRRRKTDWPEPAARQLTPAA